jgi:hypothetical protein
MSIYTSLAAVSLAQIADKGRDVVLMQPTTQPTWNPITQRMTDATVITVTVKAVVVDVSLREVDGGLIQAGDRWFLIAADGLSITPSSKITDGSQDYAVISVNEIKPADVAILYKLQCRLIGS